MKECPYPCMACAQERWLNDPEADLSCAQPPVLHHVCSTKGPKSEYQIFKQLKKVAKVLNARVQFPGAVYDAIQERDALFYRLAGNDIKE